MRRIRRADEPLLGSGARPVPGRRDWFLAGLVAALTLLEVVLRNDMPWRPLSLVLGLLLASTMLWRRKHPLAVVVVAFLTLSIVDVSLTLAAGVPISLFSGGFIVVLVYGLLRWADTVHATIGTAFVILGWTVSVITDTSSPEEVVGGALVLMLAAVLGLSMRYRAITLAQRFEQVRSQERESLARELHDTVAHHVSGIAVQAQAGRVLASAGNANGAVTALEIIEQEASRTLLEMRSMVMTLRRNDGPQSPSLPHGVDDIFAMATPAESTLRPVIEVEQHGSFDGVRPAVLTALHRVVREAVTNARRHAQPERIRIRLDGSPVEVRVRVTDDGKWIPSGVQPSGYGIVGMTERVTLLGGVLRAGALPAGGWLVEAVIPRDGAQP